MMFRRAAHDCAPVLSMLTLGDHIIEIPPEIDPTSAFKILGIFLVGRAR